jgi:CheY-like chemotaxis protein
MIRVLLADDQTLVRAGFRALPGAQGDIEVAGEASDGEQAVSLARQVVPDVILMDIPMPGTGGLAATRQIAAGQRLAGVRVVILTTFELDEYVFEAIRSGAAGFLVKDTDPDMLDEHDGDEQDQIFPAMRRYLPAPAYQWHEQQIQRNASWARLRFTTPWLARFAEPAELIRMLAAGGWRAQLLLAAPRGARLERQAFGTPS